MLSFYLSLIDTAEEKDKLEQIYIKYKNLMLKNAFDILGDSALAQDAVHNAFLKIIPNLNKIDETDCHKTMSFVVIIVRNVSKTMYAKRKKELHQEIFEDTVQSNDSIEKTVKEKNGVEILAKVIEKLPEKYREVLILKYLNDLDNNEISKLLDISAANVRKRIQRAKEMLYEVVKGSELDG